MSNREWCNSLLWILEERGLMVLTIHHDLQRLSVIMHPDPSRIYKIILLTQPRLLPEMWCVLISWYSLQLKNPTFLLFASLHIGKRLTWWKTLEMWGKFSQQIVTVIISPHQRNKDTDKGYKASKLFDDDERKKIGLMLFNFEYGKMMSSSFPWATHLDCCH